MERSRSLHRDIPFLRAITAYEKGDDQLALKELDGSDFHRNLTLRALLTAHCDRQAALALFRDVMAERSGDATHLFDPSVLLLCGEHQEAARLARESLRSGHVFTDFQVAQLQFVAGELTEEEFFNSVASTDKGYLVKTAQYMIGLKHLAVGDRAGARTHFQQATEPFAETLPACHLSQAFLRRMDADVHWPRSIRSDKP